MLQALYWISSNHIQKVVIITDSLSALRAIQHPNWKRHQTANKIVQLNHSLLTSSNTITFLWTPAHSIIPGNETADQLAKISTSDPPIPTPLEIHRKQSTLPLSLPDMYALIKTSSFAVWNDKCTNSPKVAHYKQIFQTIENGTCGPRSCDSPILFRLQTGHNSLYFHLHRIGPHPDGLCKEYRSPETVTHFLLQCPKYTHQRSKLKHTTDKLHIDFNLQSLLHSEAAAAHVLAYAHDTNKTI